MQLYEIPIWKTAPFARIILPFITGIVLQWYLQATLTLVLILLSGFLTAFLLIYFLPLARQYKARHLQGIFLFLIIGCAALLASWRKDIRNDLNWFGHFCSDSSRLVVRVDEPVLERSKSYKVTAVVETVINDSTPISVTGKLFIYLAKDTPAAALKYGDRILVSKPLQRIRNSGNPGAFNYERYAAFHQTFHTVYLKANDWVLLKGSKTNALDVLIFSMQDYVIVNLQKYISGDKNVLGIAEALLIGYKEDLDKDLVQSYSNAGVVHIIAISGLHLGLIYVMLSWIFGRLPLIKKQKLLKVILILSCLWLFSLLTGASASVLRSAVMFTCILIGNNFFNQTSIYNSLAASAFILLCYDPYLLWDVGFQLSYLAVIGIVALQKPIINLFYFKNAWLSKCWNMLAVTIAAQLITFPLCIYYFHQFPNLFFITNLVAVPLSTVILFVEIFLIAFSWIPYVGLFAGKLTGGLVWLMNAVIKLCNSIPYSLLDNIYADLLTTWLLYIFIVAACAWLINKKRIAFRVTLYSLLLFVAVHAYARVGIYRQKKIIIYNVPQQQAIDFIYRDQYHFTGDSMMLADGVLKNFHLKPARIALQAVTASSSLPSLYHAGSGWLFFGKKIILIDTATHFSFTTQKLLVDVLLLSHNPRIRISELVTAIRPSIIVFDASNSLWKIAGWKKECLALALPCFSIPGEGAFILAID